MVKIEVSYPLQVSSVGVACNITLYYYGHRLPKPPWNLHFEGNTVPAEGVELDVNSKLHRDGHISCKGSVWLVGERRYWIQRDG